METVSEMAQALRSMKKRQVAGQLVSLGLIVTSALMIWKFLMIASASESPVVVVLSGSMEPSFRRGDILFLWMQEQTFAIGDIVVFKIDQREIPIVHRVHRVYERSDGDVDLLTKGDNNMVDDRGLYAPGQLFLNRRHIIGKATAFLPRVGIVTIIMNDYPYVKYLLIGVLCIFVLTSRE